MCLIIHKPAGKSIPKWVIESASQYNPDGTGMVIGGKAHKWLKIKPNKVHKRIEQLKHRELALHFRWRTHGEISLDNVHPFKLVNNSYLMHNGILHSYASESTYKIVGKGKVRYRKKRSKKSDTVNFIEQFLNPTILAAGGTIPRKMFEKEIEGNAILVMDRGGNITRYGKDWLEFEGCHYSNDYAWDCPYYAARYVYNWSSEDQTSRAVTTTDDNIYNAAYGYGSAIMESEMPYYHTEMRPKVRKTKKNKGGDWHLSHEDRESIISDLWSIEHVLPLYDQSIIAYDDWQLIDEMMTGALFLGDFLYDCTNASLISLYEWAVNNGHLREVA